MAVLGSTRDDWIAIELCLDNEYAKPYFHQLHADKNVIENELGFVVEWLELPDKKTSRIRCFNNGTNPMNREVWPEHFAWFHEKLEAFVRRTAGTIVGFPAFLILEQQGLFALGYHQQRSEFFKKREATPDPEVEIAE